MSVVLVITEGHVIAQGLISHLGPGIFLAWAAAEGQVWVCGPIAAEVRVDVRGSCCHQGPCGCLGSCQSPEFMLVTKSYAVAGAIWISEACAVTKCHDDFQARAAAEGQV